MTKKSLLKQFEFSGVDLCRERSCKEHTRLESWSVCARGWECFDFQLCWSILWVTYINLREKPPLHRNYAVVKEFGTFRVPQPKMQQVCALPALNCPAQAGAGRNPRAVPMANEPRVLSCPQHWARAAAPFQLNCAVREWKQEESRLSWACSRQGARGSPRAAERGRGRWGRCWSAA